MSGGFLVNTIIRTYNPYVQVLLSASGYIAVIASYARYVSISRRGVTRVLVDGAGAAGCRYKINVVSLP